MYIGIDGEGIDYGGSRQDHRYTLLAASTEEGRRQRQWWLEDYNGLHTKQCLDFLLELPRDYRAFAYSFNYDLTKILTDIDNARLYLLFRSELRQTKGKHSKPKPISWQGYEINLQGTKFSLSRGSTKFVTKIWDIWKFYQSKFTSALLDWKAAPQDIIDRIQKMKEKRNDFAHETPDDIRRYCLSECAYLATLARKLDEAHSAAGLKLTSYYGAGSSASAMLKKDGIREQIRGVPDRMIEPVAQAFFGGRFEHSVVGSINKPVINWDISSAYPYQLCFLPCLRHSNWRLTRKRKDLTNASAALVHYGLNPNAKCEDWAPFPFRESDGSICFPAKSGGGWVWLDEYLEGELGWPSLVQFREAWVLERYCDCKPFKNIPHYYRERCRIGKEGAGIVFKLGPNSCYGKLAQSIGSAPFNCWVWAGMITSGCRAQLLQMLCRAKDRSNVLMLATDGLYTSEEFRAPNPLDTGTSVPYLNPDRKQMEIKPLGGWERTDYPNGMFAARPGIYFPLNPTDKDLKKVRARGIGKNILFEQWKTIIAKYEEIAKTGSLEVTKGQEFRVQNVDRFCGAKTSISYRASDKKFIRAKGGRVHNGQPLPAYGQWIVRPVQMSFDPMPKRAGLVAGSQTRLALRELPVTLESTPYKKSLISKEGRELMEMQDEIEEQPDIDWYPSKDYL